MNIGKHNAAIISVVIASIASVSSSCLSIADDRYYYRVKAPHLGEVITLSVSIDGPIVGDVGQPIRAHVRTANGENSRPFKYSISSGELAPGLTLNADTGEITGTPTAGGLFSATIFVQGSEKATGTTIYESTIYSSKRIAVTQPNLNLSALFSQTEWQSATPKRVIVSSRATIYSINTSKPALYSGSGWNGTLTLQIENGAEIQGAGGTPIENNVGGNGGDAISTQQGGLLIINDGAIRAGGGAGGSGGKGADGFDANNREPAIGTRISNAEQTRTGCYSFYSDGSARWYTEIYWNGSRVYSTSGTPSDAHFQFNTGIYTYNCDKSNILDLSFGFIGQYMYATYRTANNATTVGGTPGSGGLGQGYNQSATAGTAGNAGSTQSAGSGGQGGAGGAWGISGQPGHDGGASNVSSNFPAQGFGGGQPGYAIRGTVNYTGSGIKQGN